jgi:hypothetical protein
LGNPQGILYDGFGGRGCYSDIGLALDPLQTPFYAYLLLGARKARQRCRRLITVNSSVYAESAC